VSKNWNISEAAVHGISTLIRFVITAASMGWSNFLMNRALKREGERI